MIDLPPMKAVLAFEVVARLASFGKAAEELNLTTPAISHQIATLEEYVGRRLFERTSRGVTLTAAGEVYRRSVVGALALISSAAENARAEESFEILHLHSHPSFASLWLMPRLPKFMTLYPETRIRLSVTPTHADFLRGEVDVDIRYGARRWPDLHVEEIFLEEIMPMFSPKMRDKLSLRSPEDLLLQGLILSEVNLVSWQQWFAAHDIPMSPSQYALRVDRGHLAIEAAAQGLGIALESNKLAERLLRNGELVPVFPDRKGIGVHQHHIAYPPHHGQREKVARFVSWVHKEAQIA